MAPLALPDGGMETTLLFHEGFELPCFAAFPLLGEARGRAALRRYFEPFLATAQERGLPRANRPPRPEPVAVGKANVEVDLEVCGQARTPAQFFEAGVSGQSEHS